LFIEGIQKGSPPFGKGRRGGIYGNAFSKNLTDIKFRINSKDGKIFLRGKSGIP
jgi:hypothetical protein